MGKKQEKLKWTKEKPSKQGWYWIKKDSDKLSPRIIYVYHPDDFIDYYEWAGPIEEPEE